MSEIKYEFFLPPYQIAFFLHFDQAHALLLHHILMKILSMNFYNYD